MPHDGRPRHTHDEWETFRNKAWTVLTVTVGVLLVLLLLAFVVMAWKSLL